MKDEQRQALGQTLESQRLAANLSIEEAVRRSGLSRTTWRDVEKARGSSPSRMVLHRMADAIGIPRREVLALAGYDPGPDEPLAVDAGRIARLEAELADQRDRLAELSRVVRALRLPNEHRGT